MISSKVSKDVLRLEIARSYSLETGYICVRSTYNGPMIHSILKCLFPGKMQINHKRPKILWPILTNSNESHMHGLFAGHECVTISSTNGEVYAIPK